MQWDTVSLMSLLNVHVILAYYETAELNPRRSDKITNQKFNIELLRSKLNELRKYNPDALHWNLKQLADIGRLGDLAIQSYRDIASRLNVQMHGFDSAQRRIAEIRECAEDFKQSSRTHAQKAALRELLTLNPKEFLRGEKATITIENYVKGLYHFTVDEAWILKDNELLLVEAKHTCKKSALLPSRGDIKDALIKMALFTNLTDIKVGAQIYEVECAIKLTTTKEFLEAKLTASDKEFYNLLKEDAEINNFKILHK